MDSSSKQHTQYRRAHNSNKKYIHKFYFDLGLHHYIHMLNVNMSIHMLQCIAGT